jgi:septum site-determining protein MinD
MAKVIVVFSTKGGVGKTVISTNLSVCLTKDGAQKVLLIDLDLQVVGDMANMLDLKPRRAMVDLISHLKKDEDLSAKKGDFLTRHSAGFDFLPGVLKLQQTPHLDAEKIREALLLFENDYDYIIIDGGQVFNDVLVSALNLANLILLVVTPDILSIYQTKWALDTLQFLQFPLMMIRIILNRAESMSSISLEDIMSSLPHEIISQIPSDGRAVCLSINRGVPVVLDNPRSKVSKTLKELAHLLINQKSLFIPRQEADGLKLKDLIGEKSGDLWQKKGLTAPLAEVGQVSKEEVDEIVLLKRKVHEKLIEELNLRQLDWKTFTDVKKTRALNQKAEIAVTNIMAKEAGSFISSPEVRRRLVKEILDEALGFGPLEDLLADPEITDIMVNNKDEIYIERLGKIEVTDKKFVSNDQVKVIIERIIAPIGRRIDESQPMVDARLPDGSRVNAIIPPLSLTGPTLTIRKFRKERFRIEELLDWKTLSSAMVDFLRACVLARKNIIVSGGTGSGKTTLLNILSTFIPDNERIVTIEDAAELKLDQVHWIRLESRSPNIEGKGAIAIRDLFRNTLRMRPDRVVIGECRGVETLDMLQAMNTGHDGSMTTVHANSTQDVLVRLDSMILMAGVELPIRAIREMIASAIHIVVHTARLSDGSRKVVQITEVAGMQDELHINLKDIFIFKQVGVDTTGRVLGDFQAAGYIPSFLEDIKIKGIPLSEDIFRAP